MDQQTLDGLSRTTTALFWPACDGGMNLRLQLPERDHLFAAEMRGLILQAMEDHAPPGEAMEHTCLIVRNVPGVTGQYLERFGAEGLRGALPLALFVGGKEMDAGLPSRVAWVPAHCDPWVLAWMLDHLSADAWRWSGRHERRREPRSCRSVALTPQLRLVDLSADGCQLESQEPFAGLGSLSVPLDSIVPRLELQLRIVRTRRVPGAFRAHGYFTGFPTGLREVVQDALRVWNQQLPSP